MFAFNPRLRDVESERSNRMRRSCKRKSCCSNSSKVIACASEQPAQFRFVGDARSGVEPLLDIALAPCDRVRAERNGVREVVLFGPEPAINRGRIHGDAFADRSNSKHLDGTMCNGMHGDAKGIDVDSEVVSRDSAYFRGVAGGRRSVHVGRVGRVGRCLEMPVPMHVGKQVEHQEFPHLRLIVLSNAVTRFCAAS